MAEQLLIPQAEACRRLGISRPTLVAEIEAGRLRYVLVGKRRKFKPSDLESYIERQRRGCDGSEAWSRNARVHLTTTKISRLKAIDFDEALARGPGAERYAHIKDDEDSFELDDAPLLGTPEEIIARLKRLEAGGVQNVLFAAPGASVAGLRTFAEEIMPAFDQEPMALAQV